MLIFIFTLFPIIASIFIGILCALSDFNRLKIPNQYLLIVIGLFVFAQIGQFIIGPELSILPSLSSALIAAVILFVISAGMFAGGLMGAGDSKMMTAYALFIGLSNITAFLFYMAITGALLGVASLLFGKYKPIKSPKEDSWIFFAQKGDKTKVPYGIAILTGTIIAYIYADYFDVQTYLSLLTR